MLKIWMQLYITKMTAILWHIIGIPIGIYANYLLGSGPRLPLMKTVGFLLFSGMAVLIGTMLF